MKIWGLGPLRSVIVRGSKNPRIIFGRIKRFDLHCTFILNMEKSWEPLLFYTLHIITKDNIHIITKDKIEHPGNFHIRTIVSKCIDWTMKFNKNFGFFLPPLELAKTKIKMSQQYLMPMYRTCDPLPNDTIDTRRNYGTLRSVVSHQRSERYPGDCVCCIVSCLFIGTIFVAAILFEFFWKRSAM